MARAAVIAAVLAAGCRREAAAPPPDLPAVGAQMSLLRFPGSGAGGAVEAYRPDSLRPAGWASYPVPRIRRVLGADLDERLLWALDTRDSLVGVDLETRGVRKRLGRIVTGASGADGSLYLVDATRRIVRVARREVARFHDSLPGPPRALFATVSDQVVAVVASPARLITASAEQVVHSVALPSGDVAATPWGDLVAVAGDSGVFLFETGGPRDQRQLASGIRARRVTFSPSGHRLYVSQEDPRIRVFDRFNLVELAPIELPGPPREFRVDASGRWLLVHREAGDSVWVIDLTTRRQVAAILAEWSLDLPLVAGASSLVVRQASDVVSFDLRAVPLAEAGRLEGGGRDIWMALTWVPPERASAALAAADSARLTQDTALASGIGPAPVDSTALYLQVSRTQNPEWATLLVKQLQADGYPASVLEPVEMEDGFRVLVGPYPAREVADSVGRAMGRAYFLLRLPAKPQ